MKNKFIITIATIAILTGGLLAFANNQTIQFNPTYTQPFKDINTKVSEPIKAVEKEAVSTSPKDIQSLPINAGEYVFAEPLAFVNTPDQYLGKKIKFKASFDKFSTLGLDYKPAFRDSQKYISFLIKRPDVTDHTIPLSEMKIFITRDEAEKFIDLDSGDIIEVYGKVFSSALTDAWFDVDKLIVLEKKNKDSKKK